MKTSDKINEIILITECENGAAHIAPFGVRERDGLILIAPFRPSLSLDNLMSGRSATINMTDDVRVFAGVLTGRRDWPVQTIGSALILASALSYQSLELVKVEDDQVRPNLYFRVIKEEMLKAFQGYNRAQAAVIELCVLVSRLNMLPLEKITQEMSYLGIAIEKTGSHREIEAWKWLVEVVENHQAQISGGHIA